MTFLSSLPACGQAELLETEITLTKMVTIFIMGDFFWSTYIYLWYVLIRSRYLLRFFDGLANPNLSANFATDQK